MHPADRRSRCNTQATSVPAASQLRVGSRPETRFASRGQASFGWDAVVTGPEARDRLHRRELHRSQCGAPPIQRVGAVGKHGSVRAQETQSARIGSAAGRVWGLNHRQASRPLALSLRVPGCAPCRRPVRPSRGPTPVARGVPPSRAGMRSWRRGRPRVRLRPCRWQQPRRAMRPARRSSAACSARKPQAARCRADVSGAAVSCMRPAGAA